MKTHLYYLIITILVFTSCELESTDAPTDVIQTGYTQVNELFFRELKSGNLFYKSSVEPNIEGYKQLFFDSSEVKCAYLDSSTFEFFGTFGFDKNNIYTVNSMSGEFYITVEEKSKYSGDTFFENSRFRIVNDHLTSVGCCNNCLDDSLVYDSSVSLYGQSIDPKEVNILLNDSTYEVPNQYVLYNNQLYRHGCLVIDDKFDNQDYYVQNRRFAKKIEF